MTNDQFRFSVCLSRQAFETKPTEEEKNTKYGSVVFERYELTIEEFKEKIAKGHMFHNAEGKRLGTTEEKMKSDGFSSQYVVLDVDGDKKSGIFPTKSDKVSVRTEFHKLGIPPTIEYDTFSASPNQDDDLHKFRMVWILSTPIDSERYSELSKRINITAETKLPFKADTANIRITQPFNGTDKCVECFEDRIYTYEQMAEALSSISEEEVKKYNKKKKHSVTRRTSNELTDSKALNELMDLGVYSFLRKYRDNFPPISNSKDQEYYDDGSDITVLPDGYEVFCVPVKIKDGKVERKRLKDGEKRNLWIFNWSGTLSDWLLKNPNLLGKNCEWKYRFITTICQLIWENFEKIDDIDIETVAKRIEEGYAFASDRGNKKKFKFNREDITRRYAMSTNKEYIDYVRRNCAKYACDIRKKDALSKYDFNKTIDENAKEIGTTEQTLKNYLKMENVMWKTNKDKTTDKLTEYCKKNAEYGAAGVMKLMEIEKETLGFEIPRSRTTIYKIFNDNAIPTKGTTKLNQILNKVAHDTDETAEKTKAANRKASIALEESKELRKKVKELLTENEELKSEIELYRSEREKDAIAMATMMTSIDTHTEDIATLNSTMVETVDRVSVIESQIGLEESYRNRFLNRTPCVPRS